MADLFVILALVVAVSGAAGAYIENKVGSKLAARVAALEAAGAAIKKVVA